MNAAAVNNWVVHIKFPRWRAGLITGDFHRSANVFFPAVDIKGKPFERCFVTSVLRPATENDIRLALTEGQARWRRFADEEAKKRSREGPFSIQIVLAGLMSPR